MRKLLLIVMATLLYMGNLMAQKTITGKVTDEKGTPLPNASVIVKGTATGTITKEDGTYSLSIPASAKTLVFSLVSMAPVEVALSSKTVFNVTMSAEEKSLSEVVVTGYSKEKRSQFVGSATTMSSKVVETVPVGSFDQALQGRAPGVLVNSASGQPGTSANINIRGIHSITGAFAQPLFIIDGVPIPAGDMATMNANDFESITVLKDASAAAVYGARGGLGVIVITTKRGKAGTTNFSYRSQYGFTQPPEWNKFDMMNTKEMLTYEERLKLTNNPGWTYSKNNPTYATLPPTSPAGNPYAASQARYNFLLDSIGNIDMYYGDVLFRQGFSQSHEINASGGNGQTKYFISAGYFKQEGTDLTADLERYTTRFNLDFTHERLSIQFNNAMGYSIQHNSEGELAGNSPRNSFQIAWRAKTYEDPYRADGSLIYGANTTLALKQIGNAIEGMENSLLRRNQIKITSGLNIAYKLFPTFVVRDVIGIDVSDNRWQRFVNPNSYSGSLQPFQAGVNSEAYAIYANLINTLSGVYTKRINSIHEIEAGGYFEIVKGYNKGLGFTLYNLDPRLSQTGQGTGVLPTNGAATYPQNATSAKSEYGIRSFFGTGRYTYKNKYTITANVRNDGTSRIANDENKNIATWSTGVLWNAIGEDFVKGIGFLTDLKVRASYGSVPNIGSITTGSFGAGGGLVSVPNYLGPQVPAYGSTTYAGSSLSAQAPASAYNPNLKIETIRKLNVGADFAVWKSRARFSFDYYNDKTEDLFVSLALPSTSGFGNNTIPINAGIMRNSGVEMVVAVDIIKKNNMDLTFSINHAINKNMIEDLGPVSEIPQGTFIIRKGLPYGSHYTQHYLGADPATGKPRFEKADGTETLDPGQGAQFAKYGTFLPKHVGGFTLDYRIGNLTISALFSYQFDVTRYNNIENWVTRGVAGYQSVVNGSKRLLTDQWQKPGDNSYYQAPQYDRGFNSSDIQDAKFMRFRNLNIGYNIPQIDIKGTRIFRSARFYVQMQNIAIWSPWRGPDPEDNNNISLNEYPNPKMFVTGLDINF